MAFDTSKFRDAKLAARTGVIQVPELVDFFAPGDKPEWKVRGVTGAEMYRASEAVGRAASLEAVATAIANKKDAVNAIRKAIGLTDDVPGEMARRLELMVAGSVEPKVELEDAVRVAEFFPIEFTQITNEITLLTGRGAVDLGKPAPVSPATQASR